MVHTLISSHLQRVCRGYQWMIAYPCVLNTLSPFQCCMATPPRLEMRKEYNQYYPHAEFPFVQTPQDEPSHTSSFRANNDLSEWSHLSTPTLHCIGEKVEGEWVKWGPNPRLINLSLPVSSYLICWTLSIGYAQKNTAHLLWMII